MDRFKTGVVSNSLFYTHKMHRKQGMHSRAIKSSNPFANYTYLQNNHTTGEQLHFR